MTHVKEKNKSRGMGFGRKGGGYWQLDGQRRLPWEGGIGATTCKQWGRESWRFLEEHFRQKDSRCKGPKFGIVLGDLWKAVKATFPLVLLWMLQSLEHRRQIITVALTFSREHIITWMKGKQCIPHCLCNFLPQWIWQGEVLNLSAWALERDWSARTMVLVTWLFLHLRRCEEVGAGG